MMKALLVVLAIAFSVQAASWAVVDNDYATIAMSCAFQSSTTGWVAGGSSSLQPLLLHTTNAGGNFTNSGLSDSSVGAFMSLSMYGSNYGIAGALGFFGLPCGAYTNDGKTWSVTHEGKDIICASQDTFATDAGQTMIIVGQWSEPGNWEGDGFQISTDAGQTFTGRNWNQGTSARYSWFSSGNFGYVSGGMWPEESASDKRMRVGDFFSRFPYQYSRHIQFDGRKFSRSIRAPLANVTGYVGIIASATNGGQTFNTVLNLTNDGVYFNQISCTDQNTCWAVCEGTNKTNGYDAAYVYFTNNGWKTYSTQLYVQGGSLVAIQMLNSTYGWAGGALIQSSSAADSPESATYGQFYLTTDGKTWTLDQQIKNFYVMDFSVVDGNNAYAAGITNLGLSSLARYF